MFPLATMSGSFTERAALETTAAAWEAGGPGPGLRGPISAPNNGSAQISPLSWS